MIREGIMERFEFDTSKAGFGANDNRKNGKTSHGAIELYPNHLINGFLSLDIRGPAGAFRGSVIIDKATAAKVGAALLKYAAHGDLLGDLLAACEAVLKGEGTDDEILNQVAEAVAKVKAT
jgi:hypothetical protein